MGPPSVTSLHDLDLAGARRLDPRAAALLDRASHPNMPTFELLELQARVRKAAFVAFQHRDGEILRSSAARNSRRSCRRFRAPTEPSPRPRRTAPNCEDPRRILGISHHIIRVAQRPRPALARAGLFRCLTGWRRRRNPRSLAATGVAPAPASRAGRRVRIRGREPPAPRPGRSGRFPGPSAAAGDLGPSTRFPAPPAPSAGCRRRRSELRCRRAAPRGRRPAARPAVRAPHAPATAPASPPAGRPTCRQPAPCAANSTASPSREPVDTWCNGRPRPSKIRNRGNAVADRPGPTPYAQKS